MNRAQRRKLGINKKPDVEQRLGLFDKLPDKCTNCEKPYDKKSKIMATTWSVVVREQENKVNLYCPECMEWAKNFIKEVKEEIHENKT
jgi:hypothetical protein